MQYNTIQIKYVSNTTRFNTNQIQYKRIHVYTICSIVDYMNTYEYLLVPDTFMYLQSTVEKIQLSRTDFIFEKTIYGVFIF